MFGYILPDKPNMYVKDFTLYRAYYCGLCKSTKQYYGNLMRMFTNYDLTFLNILIHGLKGEKADIGKGSCILNPIEKKPYVVKDKISADMVHLNVLLSDFKSRDDMLDAPDIKKKIISIFLKRKKKKAKKALPEIASILDTAYTSQQMIENQNIASPDRAADPFSVAMQNIFKQLLKEKYTEEIGIIAYNLAKFVYIMDAIDDFEDDVKKNQYNVLKLMYPEIKNKSELIDSASVALNALTNGIIASISEAYEKVPITVNEGIVTNTLWFGLKTRAEDIMNKENKQCQKTRF